MDSSLFYLRISIISTQEQEMSHKAILNIIKEGIDKREIFTTIWEESGQTISLLATTKENNNFTAFYTGSFVNMDKIMQIISEQNVNIQSLFPIEKMNEEESSPYLILKFETNYKKPMRDNFQYYQWFAAQFRDMISYEEIQDGFLRFYQRKIDFLRDNIPRNTIQGVMEWLKMKRANLPDELKNVLKNIFQ